MNQAVNFFWTTLCCFPMLNYWMIPAIFPWHYPFLILSLLSLFLPSQWLQLSNNPKFYENLGVKFARRFVQNGDYINRFIRRKNAAYRVVKQADPKQYLQTVLMYERYHFFCFVFFLGTTIHAVFNRHFTNSAALIVANIVYNVFPILLQQYNRARLMKIDSQK